MRSHFITALFILFYYHYYVSNILGALEKLRQATVSFVMSVSLSISPSVRKEQLGFQWTDFHEIWYLGIFRRFVEEIQVLFKSDKNNGYFT